MRAVLGLVAAMVCLPLFAQEKFRNQMFTPISINNMLIDPEPTPVVEPAPDCPGGQCSARSVTGQCSTGSCGTSNSRQSRRDRRRGIVYEQAQPMTTIRQADTITAPKEAPAIAPGQSCADALDEVNKSRAAKGLPALKNDPLLAQGAYACAKERARLHIHGHLTSDFDYLPAGAKATATGCAALETHWGWQSCCWDEPQWTTAGAAWVMGDDGRRYMHIVVR